MTPITVNHKEIPEAIIGQEMQYHPAASRQEAWQRAAEALVLRELLLQEAHREAVAQVDNDEAELIDLLLARVLRVDEPETDAVSVPTPMSTWPPICAAAFEIWAPVLVVVPSRMSWPVRSPSQTSLAFS